LQKSGNLLSVLEGSQMEVIPEPGQGRTLQPRAELREPLVPVLSDEFDPEAAIRHRSRKPTDARQYPRGIDVEFAKRNRF
jgi:hypothetical protein